MKIIAGLGNIGEEYAETRHNAGFMLLDNFLNEIQEKNPQIKWKNEKKLDAISAKVEYKGETLLLIKPATFMNNSGIAIRKILNFYKETPKNLIVIHDDIDLPLGKIRIRQKGSAGTHNGMKSIIEELKTEEFTRIKIGIESRGTLSPQIEDLAKYVLGKFSDKEREILAKTTKEARKSLKELILLDLA